VVLFSRFLRQNTGGSKAFFLYCVCVCVSQATAYSKHEKQKTKNEKSEFVFFVKPLLIEKRFLLSLKNKKINFQTRNCLREREKTVLIPCHCIELLRTADLVSRMIHGLVKLLNASLRRVRRQRAQLLIYKQRREYQKELSAITRLYKKRNVYERVDFVSTEWGRQLRDPRTSDPSTKEGSDVTSSCMCLNNMYLLKENFFEIAFVCHSQSFLTLFYG
jgi:hypothetical protein